MALVAVGGCSVVHSPTCIILNLDLENLYFHRGFANRSGDIGFGGSMIRRRVSGSVTETAKSIIPFAANATKSVPRSKVLFLGMFAPLLAAVAVQILFRAEAIDHGGRHIELL